MEPIQKILSAIRCFFFPMCCGGCGKTLGGSLERLTGLCSECRPALVIPGGERCSVCGKPLVSETGRCMACRGEEAPFFERNLTLFPYEGIYKRVFYQYKFGENPALARFFCDSIFAFLQKAENLPPVWTVVPPRPGKVKQTGWDQMLHLARTLKSQDRGPAFSVETLLRRLPSKTQKKLDRAARLENLRNRFVPVRDCPPRVLLIDDIITTGATINACAEALKKAGAREVWCLTLFYGV